MEFTLNNVSTEVVSITPAATQAVINIMKEKNLENHALRIYVAGSSCSGVQYGIAIDENILDTDTQVDAEGLKILVDHQSLDYVRGASVDYITDPQHGTGFTITNPNAPTGGGCGCGGSEDSASCGGGGGSCGCSH